MVAAANAQSVLTFRGGSFFREIACAVRLSLKRDDENMLPCTVKNYLEFKKG